MDAFRRLGLLIPPPGDSWRWLAGNAGHILQNEFFETALAPSRVKVWSGSEWLPASVYNGSAWVPLRIWDGLVWAE